MVLGQRCKGRWRVISQRGGRGELERSGNFGAKIALMMAMWISLQADPTLEELMRCKRCKQTGYFSKEASTYIYLYLGLSFLRTHHESGPASGGNPAGEKEPRGAGGEETGSYSITGRPGRGGAVRAGAEDPCPQDSVLHCTV